MTVEIKWFGSQAKQARKAGTTRGLFQAAEFVRGEALKQVPLDETTLARSGSSDVDAEIETASVSFDTPYAVRQHEELTWRHKGNRKAKYLEDPVQDTRDKQARIIAQAIERDLT